MDRQDLNAYMDRVQPKAAEIVAEKEHAPMVHVFFPDERGLQVIGFADMRNDADKDKIRMLIEQAVRQGAIGVVWIAEAWMAFIADPGPGKRPEDDPVYQEHGGASKMPNRRECLVIEGACAEGMVHRVYLIESKNGRRALVEQEQFDGAAQSRFVGDLPWRTS